MLAVDVNLWAVLAATIGYFLIGALWYSPALFAKPWMDLMGKKAEDMSKSGDASVFAITFVLQLGLAYVLAHILAYVGAVTLMEAITAGIWVWFGFVFTTMTITSLFAGDRKKLLLINAGYHLVGILSAAAIISLWS